MTVRLSNSSLTGTERTLVAVGTVRLSSMLAAVRAGYAPPVPAHLRDGHYEGAKAMGNAVGYVYPHDDPLGVVKQQYMPDGLEDAVYYEPTDHGAERRIKDFIGRLRALVRGR